MSEKPVLSWLAGAGIFAMLYEAIKPALIDPLTFGKPTLHSWLGIGSLWIAIPIGLIASGVIARWLRAERRLRAAHPAAPRSPEHDFSGNHRAVKQR